jgi:hypothetical protein
VTRDGPGAAPSRGGTWRPRCYPMLRGMWQPGSSLESGARAGAVETHGDLRAALSRKAEAVVLT